MDSIILSQTTKDNLVKEITDHVLSGITELLEQTRQKEFDSKEWLTAKETEKILKVSNVTVWTWTNKGILKSYKVGNRIRYRKDEVLKALIKIEAKRH